RLAGTQHLRRHYRGDRVGGVVKAVDVGEHQRDHDRGDEQAQSHREVRSTGKGAGLNAQWRENNRLAIRIESEMPTPRESSFLLPAPFSPLFRFMNSSTRSNK